MLPVRLAAAPPGVAALACRVSPAGHAVRDYLTDRQIRYRA
jgi:hypothetical protein